VKGAAVGSRGHTGGVTDIRPGRSAKRDSVLITDLATSRTEEIRNRERNYVILMLFRVVCFVAATLLFHGPARWLAVALAVMLPWLAVVLANAPAKVRASRHAAYEPPTPREMPTIAPGRGHQIIEPDFVSPRENQTIEPGRGQVIEPDL
jgi:hypothetical protein